MKLLRKKTVVVKDLKKNFNLILLIICLKNTLAGRICKKEIVSAAVWGSVNRPAAALFAARNDP